MDIDICASSHLHFLSLAPHLICIQSYLRAQVARARTAAPSRGDSAGWVLTMLQPRKFRLHPFALPNVSSSLGSCHRLRTAAAVFSHNLLSLSPLNPQIQPHRAPHMTSDGEHGVVGLAQ